MTTVLIGNLFESKAQTLVNTVNCVGIMGKGIALEFKRRFPEMFKDYSERCKRKDVVLGRPYIFKPTWRDEKTANQYLFPEMYQTTQLESTHWIVNFPTKDHWRSVARLEDIIKGLEFLLAHYKEWGIKSLAIPPLGCGEGQLEWRIVGPTLYRYLCKMDIPVELYAPYNTPHEELQPQFLSADKTNEASMPDPKWIPASWVILVEIIKCLQDEPYNQHPFIGKTIFQKIAYAASKAGVDTKLEFRQASYGPYSEELQKNVLSRLINNGLLVETYLGKMHALRPGPTYVDARKAYASEIQAADQIIKKTVDLFMRLNTEQAEIIATVIFAADKLTHHHKAIPSEEDVFNYVMNWKQKKVPPLSKEKVAIAIRNLAALEWIKVIASISMPLPLEE